MRHLKLVRWFIGIFGGALVALWIALAVVSRAPVLQKKLIEALDSHMDADVQLESFTVDSFPTLRIHGDNLRLRLKGQQQPAPEVADPDATRAGVRGVDVRLAGGMVEFARFS